MACFVCCSGAFRVKREQEARELIVILADGAFHSGEQLARHLDISRTAVWKRIGRLHEDFGLQVHAVRGKGYRLAAPIELLDVETLFDLLGGRGSGLLQSIELHFSCASTNALAAAALPQQCHSGRAWLAEHQSAGRGRRGRQWISALGSSINLSLAWRFDLPLASLAGLSLAAGVAVAEALADLGYATHNLKWPNDLVVEDRKLAGILVEVSGEATGPAVAVIGVGLNVRLARETAQMIDQPCIDLAAMRGDTLSRNFIAAKLLARLAAACEIFGAQRLAPFLTRWRHFDRLAGRRVSVQRGDQCIEGIYAGISDSGALMLRESNGISEHHAGEVSLRPVLPS